MVYYSGPSIHFDYLLVRNNDGVFFIGKAFGREREREDGGREDYILLICPAFHDTLSIFIHLYTSVRPLVHNTDTLSPFSFCFNLLSLSLLQLQKAAAREIEEVRDG